jgi:hypothetical protein
MDRQPDPRLDAQYYHILSDTCTALVDIIFARGASARHSN